MPYGYNDRLISNARSLRCNMTPEEKKLWYDFLKSLPVTVKRQKIVGNYILDFYIASARLAIELDGVQHRTDEHRAADEARDAYLFRLGITVLRYPSQSIHNNFPFVCADILKHL